ncbi:hypothetical protein E2C01_051682 [Portunus trituberculatus]|uniref:Uncharacterized protein n=1 Tax=Portunus trituberculatus TaxID=210409 RepID=A0A5B7GK02_PORTR|nr:hypothetical protein [Portunus trituberculatus]
MVDHLILLVFLFLLSILSNFPVSFFSLGDHTIAAYSSLGLIIIVISFLIISSSRNKRKHFLATTVLPDSPVFTMTTPHHTSFSVFYEVTTTVGLLQQQEVPLG